MNSEEIAELRSKQFKAELRALLLKYDATIWCEQTGGDDHGASFDILCETRAGVVLARSAPYDRELTPGDLK